MDLFPVYKYGILLLYLFLSSVMLYHKLFRRWLTFSAGLFIVYILGSFIFFGRLPALLESQELISSLPYILFYLGTPLLLGFLLFRQLSVFQIFGLMLVFLSGLGFMLAIITNHYNRPFGFFYELTPHARAWIELGSVLLVIVGVPILLGYCFLNALTLLQTFGALLVFAGFATLAACLIWLTIGYQFLGKALRLTGALFPSVSAWNRGSFPLFPAGRTYEVCTDALQGFYSMVIC